MLGGELQAILADAEFDADVTGIAIDEINGLIEGLGVDEVGAPARMLCRSQAACRLLQNQVMSGHWVAID